MFSEDYLLRIIRQATDVVARIIGLRISGDYRDAFQEIDQNLEQLFGLDPKLIRLLDDESLYRNLSANEQLNLERLGFIADLFREEGELFQLQRKIPESESAFVRSLSFYLIMDGNIDPSHPLEVSQKINEIIQKIDINILPDKTLFELFCHFENEEKYADADGMLNILCARPGANADAVREMKSFYSRLLEKASTELSAHGMSRAAIQDKLQELE